MTNREIDRAIAVSVMGLDLMKYKKSDGCPTCGYTGFYDYPKQYSEDISAAWEVVRKITDGGCLIVLNGGAVEWECEITKNDGRFLIESDTVVTARADTAPMAICKAALRSVGVEVK